MTAQFSIDFDERLPVEAQIGMQDADAHANETWKAVLDACVFNAARRLQVVTVEDVRKELIAVNEIRKAQGKPEVTTHNLSAFGPAMIRAKEKGILEWTPEVRRNKTAGTKGNLMRCWRSNFYEGKA